VFVGTRVPVQTLVDYLEGGYSIDEFLDNFPSVRREQVNRFLEQGRSAKSARHDLEPRPFTSKPSAPPPAPPHPRAP
jgi:Protein of unknown function (DUF433)